MTNKPRRPIGFGECKDCGRWRKVYLQGPGRVPLCWACLSLSIAVDRMHNY